MKGEWFLGAVKRLLSFPGNPMRKIGKGWPVRFAFYSFKQNKRTVWLQERGVDWGEIRVVGRSDEAK